MIKPVVKAALRRHWPGMRPPLLVASMGRSGSTLVRDSLVLGMARVRFGPAAELCQGAVRDEAWDLDKARFERGRVYKTHDFPGGLSAGDEPRTVFLFGNATAAARSVLNCDRTRGRAWIEEHFEHLKASGTIDDVPYADVLRFGEQLDTWFAAETVPILSLRYEDLWNDGTEDLLSRYAGFPVRLPARKTRESAANDFGEREAAIRETYGPLDDRIARLPAVHMNAAARRIVEAAA